jgi:hypothetical protein
VNRAAFPRLVAFATLCIAVPALTVGGPAAHAGTPDPQPKVHRSSAGVLSYDDPRYAGRHTIVVKGKVETTIKESFDDRHSQQSQAITTDDGDVIPVSTRGGTALPTGGQFVGNVVETQSATQPIATATVTPETVAAAPVPSVHHAYVAVVGTSLPTMTESQADTYVDQITGYWVDQSKTSAGTSSIISWSPRQEPEIYASSNASTCLSNYSALWNEAAAKFPGVTFSSSTSNHLIVILPGCSGGGLGTVGTSLASGGKSALAIADDGADQIGAHELGHNVGLGHANIEYCDAGGGNCAIDEYGNAYSVMASVLAGPNSPDPSALDTVYRQALGLTSATELRSITLPYGAPQAVTTSVHLAPREATTGTRGVEVTDPVTGQKLLVEYRSGTGRDVNVVYTRPNYSEDLADSSTARFKPGVVISRVTSVGASTGPVDLLMTERAGSNVTTSFGVGPGEDPEYVSPTGNITVDVTADSGVGGADIAVTLDGPFLQSSKPTISGTVKVGSAVTANKGTWDSQAAISYRWLSNGVPIPNATTSTYTPTVSGKYLSVSVTGKRGGYLDVKQTSDKIWVASGTFSTVQPKITGTAKVGKILRVYRGTWTPTPTTWRYQWYSNGAPITGATHSYYTITKYRLGKRITVKVKGSRTYYKTASRTSASTATVTR